MAEKRKDSKGRVLRKGEHERTDGRYHYLYLDAFGKRCYVYAKDLLSLREMEKEIEWDLLDGISNASGKTTLNQLFKMHMELKNDLRATTNFCMNSGTYSIHIPFLTIAIGTCLRCGELTGLTWGDIDMKNRTISVNHQLIYKNFDDGCKFHVSEPKTDAGKRTIPMTEAVHRAFVELRKQNLKLGRRSDAEVDGYSNFVFVSGNGQPFAINAVNSFLLNMEKAYNKVHPEKAIPHQSAHILRHSGYTLLASAGMDIKALQNVMGHSDASITMNVYNHSSFERTEKEVQRIDNALNF